MTPITQRICKQNSLGNSHKTTWRHSYYTFCLTSVAIICLWQLNILQFLSHKYLPQVFLAEHTTAAYDEMQLPLRPSVSLLLAESNLQVFELLTQYCVNSNIDGDTPSNNTK